MSRFQGKVALVTGASSGVGRATALALANEGADTGLVGRNLDALSKTADLITSAGGRAVAIKADVGVASDVKRAVAEVVAAYDGLDLLAHAAGVLRRGAVTEFAEYDWDMLFTTNAKSCFLLAKHVIPHMRARGGGAIVNVSSVLGFAAGPGSAAYAASKAAVTTLTKIIALDHITEGIRINCVAPGTMRTRMTEALAAESHPDNADEVFGQIGKLHPIGRLIEPNEVASLILYLLSDEASAIVGACYTIDGGRLAKLGTANDS